MSSANLLNDAGAVRGALGVMLEEALALPFFEEHHRAFARRLAAFADGPLALLPHDTTTREGLDAACRARALALGEAGFLRAVVPAANGGLHPAIDARALCLAREVLASRDGLADFVFAMQGLGTGAVSLFGTDEQRARLLPGVAAGRTIAAFALSEAEAGSDVAAMGARAVPDGPDHVRLTGEKTWISNGGLADAYVVFARSGEAPGARGLSAYVVPADAPGLEVAERLDVIAPHPLARLVFDAVRVPLSDRIGGPGEGFKVAMGTLDLFRPTVGAAALGFARRAQAECLERASARRLFGAPLGDLALAQGQLADSALDVEGAALLVYRAAWARDRAAPGARTTREAALAKLGATEAAGRVVDRAVQLHGGAGVAVGCKVEELFREARALRIYEGASDVQRVVIAREALRAHGARRAANAAAAPARAAE